MGTIKSIETKIDYQNALMRIDELIIKNPKEKTKGYDELNMLGSLVSDYETIHFPIPALTLFEMIKYRMNL